MINGFIVQTIHHWSGYLTVDGRRIDHCDGIYELAGFVPGTPSAYQFKRNSGVKDARCQEMVFITVWLIIKPDLLQ
jgi:hypothetical protein